jgi:hypothetical protein
MDRRTSGGRYLYNLTYLKKKEVNVACLFISHFQKESLWVRS